MVIIARCLCGLGCLIIAVAALALGWVGAETASGQAALIAGKTGYAPAVYTQLEALRAEKRRPEELTAVNLHLAERAPLSDAPFGFAGLMAIDADERERASALLTEALRRNPRNQVARIWLVNLAIEQQRPQDAIASLDVLTRVDRTRSKRWTDALTQVAMMPGGMEALSAFLVGREEPPSWVQAVVAQLNQRSADMSGLAVLNARSPANQHAFLRRVAAEQGVEEAYRTWITLSAGVVKEPVSWPYNGEFRKLPVSPPFNWLLRGNLAEMSEAGGLEVSYLGRGTAVVIEQLMRLPPGRHRFRTRLSGESSSHGGGLAWDLKCHPSGPILGTVAMRELTLASEDFQSAFEVPAQGCDAQLLLLRGFPGEFPTRARARITEVAILPENGAER